MKAQKNNRRKSLVRIFAGLVIIILINLAGTLGFFRLDLTQEKRYTLSDKTISLLREIDDIVYFKIYLGGKLPAEYAKLKNSIRETLDEFKAYNKVNIQYEFIDPAEGKDKRTLYDYYTELSQQGLQHVYNREESSSASEEQIIWPCAMVSYKGREVPVNFITADQFQDKEVFINQSIETLEFNLIDAIRQLMIDKKNKVAYIIGHSEANRMQTADMTKALGEYYLVDSVRIDHQLKALEGYKTIIIADPDSAYDEKDKFIIDQFVMKGGRVLWLMDGVYTDMDSLKNSPDVPVVSKDVNLNDMLFKYGARINPNFLLDFNSCPIPVIVGEVNGQPDYELFNWYYFPSVSNAEGHPIARNLKPVRLQIVSGIDITGGDNIKKTVLLSTSKYTRIQNVPGVISLNVLREQPNDRPSRQFFNKSSIPVAVLLEGSFNSVFANRIPPEIAENKEIDFRETSVPSRMIVVSDGDIIKNEYRRALRNNGSIVQPGSDSLFQYEIQELGFDNKTGITYGNKDFLLNCMNYLSDESDLLSIRSREFKIRMLDKDLVESQRSFIQTVNVLLPMLIIVAIGIILMLVRKFNDPLSRFFKKSANRFRNK